MWAYFLYMKISEHFIYNIHRMNTIEQESKRYIPYMSLVFLVFMIIGLPRYNISTDKKYIMNGNNWYSLLIKPTWAPPAWLFGPVWTLLYILIAISFGRVFILTFKKQIVFSIALPFILNLLFNFAFTPLQFGIKNQLFAAIDILLILSTLIWAMVVIYPNGKWITYIQIPYLLWVSFASVLQITITYLNK